MVQIFIRFFIYNILVIFLIIGLYYSGVMTVIFLSINIYWIFVSNIVYYVADVLRR